MATEGCQKWRIGESTLDHPDEEKVPSLEEEAIALNSPDDIEINESLNGVIYEDVVDELRYKIDDKPNITISILLAIQHFLTCFGSNVAVAFIISPALCITDSHEFYVPDFDKSQLVKSKILSTIFFTGGISTILQVTLGTRLPIMQGGSFAFIAPVFALMSQSKFTCANLRGNTSTIFTDKIDGTNVEVEFVDIWTRRMREIQGAIILAGIFEAIIGISGVIGFVMRYIGPVTISPVICLIGLSVMDPAVNMAGQNWFVAVVCIVTIIICSQYINEYQVPIPFSTIKLPIFGLFPVLIGITVAWITCLIVTLSHTPTAETPAFWNSSRVDTRIDVIKQAPYFQPIYPFQFGWPTFSLGGFLAMLSGSFASMLESIGDYYSLAEICHLPTPPKHAINRGIATEGIGCILSGICGTGNGATSFSENIGAIAITRAASRYVMIVAGIMLVIFSMFGKFASIFVTMPDPVVGGLFCVMFGMITGVGISNLKNCSIQSSRNLFIFGFSLFCGLALPRWVTPDKVATRFETLNSILVTVLSTSPFVGGLVSAVLDNSIKGSLAERGLKEVVPENSGCENVAYSVPILLTLSEKIKLFRYLPIIPPAKSFTAKYEEEEAQLRNPP